MPMAMRFILVAVAHERYRLAFSAQSLEQSERKFLPMILNVLVAHVDAAAFS